MCATVTWLHLSDLHMEEADAFNRGVVIEALFKDLAALRARGVAPDFVAFTGDIACHGLESEYAFAQEEFFDKLLATLDLGPEKLVVAPGNHDLSRTIANRIKSPLPELRDAAAVSRCFIDQENDPVLFYAFRHFEHFAKSHTICAGHSCNPLYADVHELQIRDHALIALVVLNTAILSSYHKAAGGEVEDQGHLAVSEHQISTAFKKVSTADLVITVMHHPSDWLMPFEREVIEPILTQNSDIILTGHLHRPNTAQVRDHFGACVIIRAGSVFDTRKSPNHYNMVQFDLQTRKGQAIHREYNDQGREWTKGIRTTGEDADGVFPFNLRETGTTEGPDLTIPRTEETFSFTDACRSDIARLGVTEDQLIRLLKNEFRSHVSYLLYDLEAYPMPVRASYLVYLNKRGHQVELYRVIPCTTNAAELASWSQILRLYRRALRIEYRERPESLWRTRSLLPATLNLHADIRKLIVKYFREHRDMDVSGISEAIVDALRKQFPGAMFSPDGNSRGMVVSARQEDSVRQEVIFRLLESESACKEAMETYKSRRAKHVDLEEAQKAIVADLEVSLQHLHKIILGFPPS
ncbi:MAG: metallophosphoesterase [Thermodesulfobacteriota bacterium]